MEKYSELKPSVFRRFSWLYAPVLAAIFPVLQMYANSVQEADPGDVAICGAVAAVAAITLTYLLRLVCPEAKRAGFAAVVIIVWCFTFSSYVRLGRMAAELVSSSASSPSGLNDLILVLIWLMVLFAALWLLLHFRPSEYRIERVYRFVKLGCLFAVILAVCQVVRGGLQTADVNTPASIWASDLEALPDTWSPGLPKNSRDVYFLIFDRYGNAPALRRFFEFDNLSFYDELEKRGFVVDRNATTCYPMTMPSMSSTLNMRYLSSSVGAIPDYTHAVQSNEVGKTFIKAGYQYHYFGNQYEPLRYSSIAQQNMKISFMPTEFEDSLVHMTPLRPLIGRHHKRTLVMERIAQIAELAKDPGLTFAYAHFLVPHPPYAFASDGSAQSEIHRTTWTEQQLYIDQLIATNRLILKLIDDILSASPVKPIIILSADEGPYLMPGDQSLSRDEQIAKRTGILSATLIPDAEVRGRLPAPMKPVNTFRFLFKEYFGAPIELLPDRTFYWENPTTSGAADTGSRILELNAPPQASN
jgi:hypothetical protein